MLLSEDVATLSASNPNVVLYRPSERSAAPALRPSSVEEFVELACSIKFPSILYPPVVPLVLKVEVAVIAVATISPTTESLVYGELVPIPIFPTVLIQ